MSKFVRLIPYNPKQGFVLKSYTDAVLGLKFVGASGWYKVEDDVAKKLASVPQEDRRPFGLKAFQIAEDKEDARRLEEEHDRYLRRVTRTEKIGTADNPVEATPDNRPGRARRAAPKKAPVELEDGDDASDDIQEPETEDLGGGEKPAGQPRTRGKRNG